MTQSIQNPVDPQQRLGEWIGQASALADQIADWSRAEGWAVDRSNKTIQEEPFGTYNVPQLRIQLPDAELFVEPVTADLGEGEGRVDLWAIPTLSRVKLLGGSRWRIMTDSNVPLRLPWTRETFAQLARDLVA